MDVIADRLTIATDEDGRVVGLIQIGAAEDLRFMLADGRSWPAGDVEIIHDGAWKFQRAVLKATGEVLYVPEDGD